MQVFNKEVLAFDIDETLINWRPEKDEHHEYAYVLDYYGEQVSVMFHHEHIRLLQATLARGRMAILWSGNGFQWAEQVLKKIVEIGLLQSTEGIIVMNKPIAYVDDVKAEGWMGQHIYIKGSNAYAEKK